MKIREHINGNIWSIIVTTLISLTLTMGAIGYSAIIERLDKMEKKIDNMNDVVHNNSSEIARHDERIKSACDEIKEIKQGK